MSSFVVYQWRQGVQATSVATAPTFLFSTTIVHNAFIGGVHSRTSDHIGQVDSVNGAIFARPEIKEIEGLLYVWKKAVVWAEMAVELTQG